MRLEMYISQRCQTNIIPLCTVVYLYERYALMLREWTRGGVGELVENKSATDL
jgi:hypothetical protein